MQIGSGWKPLGLTFFALVIMLTLAAIFGTGRGAAVYNDTARAVPIEAPSHSLGVPNTAYDDALTAQEWTAWAALIGAIASVSTLIVLILTLMTTLGILQEARKTTNAANETVKATREIGLAQIRASLGYSTPIVRIRGNSVEFSIKITNTGYSSAHRFGVSDFSLELFHSDVVKNIRLVSHDNGISANTFAAIAPNESAIRTFSLMLTSEQTLALGKRDYLKPIRVMGRGVFSFRDTFDVLCEEGFFILGHILPDIASDFTASEFSVGQKPAVAKRIAEAIRSSLV